MTVLTLRVKLTLNFGRINSEAGHQSVITSSLGYVAIEGELSQSGVLNLRLVTLREWHGGLGSTRMTYSLCCFDSFFLFSFSFRIFSCAVKYPHAQPTMHSQGCLTALCSSKFTWKLVVPNSSCLSTMSPSLCHYGLVCCMASFC